VRVGQSGEYVSYTGLLLLRNGDLLTVWDLDG
jgi:hypothetical protein